MSPCLWPLPPAASVAMLTTAPATSGSLVSVPAAPAPPASSVAALAARKADPAIGGRLARPRQSHSSVTAPAPSPCQPVVPAALSKDCDLAPMATLAAPCGLCCNDTLWVASLSSDEDDDEELAPRSPLAAALGPDSGAVRVACVGSPPAGGKTVEERVQSVGHGGLASGGVEERRGGHARRQPVSARSLAFKQWAKGRCFRCLARDHLVRDCREPFRCTGCMQRDCWRCPLIRDAPSGDLHNQPPGSPRARSWAEIAALPPLIDGRSAPCVEELRDTCDARRAAVIDGDGINKDVLDQLLQAALAAQLVLFRSQIQDMVVAAIQPLREEVSSCRVCLECDVGLDPAPHADSVDELKAEMYGCFSPRTSTLSLPAASLSEATEVVVPVLQIMPELQELCGESSVVLPMELGSLKALAVATTPAPLPSEPRQVPDSVDSGGLKVSATLSSVAIGHVMSLSDEVNEAEMLAPNSQALFAKELCGLLASLEAVCPGYGKDIACILAGTTLEDIISEVEKSLRKISLRSKRKRGASKEKHR